MGGNAAEEISTCYEQVQFIREHGLIFFCVRRLNCVVSVLFVCLVVDGGRDLAYCAFEQQGAI